MKIEWLVADVRAVGSPDRAEYAVLGVILAGRFFGQFRGGVNRKINYSYVGGGVTGRQLCFHARGTPAILFPHEVNAGYRTT